jgi:hypothetical protein
MRIRVKSQEDLKSRKVSLEGFQVHCDLCQSQASLELVISHRYFTRLFVTIQSNCLHGCQPPGGYGIIADSVGREYSGVKFKDFTISCDRCFSARNEIILKPQGMRVHCKGCNYTTTVEFFSLE